MEDTDEIDMRPGMALLGLCCFATSLCYAIYYYIIGVSLLYYFTAFMAVSSLILFYYCRKGVRRAYFITFAFFCLYCVVSHILITYYFGDSGSAFLVLVVLLAPHMYPIAKQRGTLLMDIFFVLVLNLALLINIYHTPINEHLVGNAYRIILTNVGLFFCLLELYINIFVQEYIRVFRQQLIEKASEDAVLDALTGLGNRRMLGLHQADMENFISEESPLCVAIADIDFFKKINDSYGHIVGDHVLKFTAGVMKDTFRKSDLLIRWGGEEFLIFLQHTGIEETTVLMEKFRLKMQNSPMIEGKHKIQVNMTIGVTEHLPHTSIYDTIAKADELMYQGKLKGRNRVIAQAR
jgi:diguanylate cyclase (GGDEF)-like protein